jgi:hypothetical protein
LISSGLDPPERFVKLYRAKSEPESSNCTPHQYLAPIFGGSKIGARY